MATNATPPPKPVPIWKWYEKAELRGAVATERFMMVEEVRTGKQIGIDIAYPPGVGYKDVMKDMKNVQELKSGRTLVEISYDYDTDAYTVFLHDRQLSNLRRPAPRGRWISPPVV